MKVFTNNVPSDCDYLTNGKHYEFKPDSPELIGGDIVDDSGDEIYILTVNSEWKCSHLNDKAAWEFVNE